MNNIWKRSLSMMLALVMVFSLMPVNVLATDAEPVDEHTHAYVSAVTTAATCTEDGVTTYTCECGDSYTEAIAAVGHTYENGACACGVEDPNYVEPTPEHSHEYVSAVTVEASCTAEGELTYTCACGDSYTEVIGVVDHAYADGVCGVCGGEDPDYVAPTPVPELSGEVREVYFVNAEGWEAVYAAWSFDEEYFEDCVFPGKVLEAEGELENVFVVEVPVEADDVLFSDGIEVTDELLAEEQKAGLTVVHEKEVRLNETKNYYDENGNWLSYADVLAAKRAEEAANKSAEAVAAVQAMIDALPTAFASEAEVNNFWDVTAVELDAAIEALTDEQQAQLDTSKYDAAMDAAASFTNPEFDDATTWAEADGWYWSGTTLYIKDGSMTKGKLYSALVEKYGSASYKYAASKPDWGWGTGGTEVKSGESGSITVTEGNAAVGKKTGYTWTGASTETFTVAYYYVVTVDIVGCDTGSVSYNGTTYNDGDKFNFIKGGTITVNDVDGWNAPAITQPTTSGKLTVEYTEAQANDSTIVPGTIGANIAVTVNGDPIGEGVTIAAGEAVEVVATYTGENKNTYVSALTVMDGETNCGTSFIAGESKEYVVNAATAPAIVLSGTAINYNTSMTPAQAEDAIKKLIYTVEGEKYTGAVDVKYWHYVNWGIATDEGWTELSASGTRYKFGDADSEKIQITCGNYVWEGDISLADIRAQSTIQAKSATAQYYTQMDAQQAKKAIFDAIYVSSTPALTVNDVAIEVQVYEDYWTDVTGEVLGYKAIDLLKELGNVNAKIVFAGNNGYKPGTSNSVSVKLEDAREDVTITNSEVTVSYQSETILQDVIEAIGANYNGVSYLNRNDALTADALRGAAAESKGNTLEVTVKLAQGDAQYKPFEQKVTVSFIDAWYTVSWYQENGKDLVETTDALIGTAPTHDGIEKDATAKYTYTFAGWNPVSGVENGVITGDASYKASFTETVNKYTVTFVNEDGTKLQSGEWEYGATPVYSGETPTKEATAQYTYTFAGWDKEISEVTGEVTYTATYTGTVNEYTIIFKSHDGEEKLTVAYGQVPQYTIPEDYEDGDKYFAFKGWEPEVVAVIGEATYEAIYTDAEIYKVTFDVNGGELNEDNVKRIIDGETVAAIEATREGYRFDGWYLGEEAYDFATPVTADITLTAKWVKLVTVAFEGADVEAQTFDIGEKATKPADPTKEQAIFDGWYLGEEAYDFETSVTADITLTAKWLADVNENEVDDTEETFSVTVNKANDADAYELSGEGLVKLPLSTDKTTIYVFNSKKPAITITATPVVDDGISTTYVASIGAAELTYGADFVATAEMQAKNGAEIVIDFAEAKFIYDEDGQMRFYVGMEDPDYETLYNAVITSPDYENGEVTAKYLARPAATYQMTIPVLFEYTIPLINYKIKLGGDPVDIDLDDAWLDVGESFTTLTPEELQAQYDTEIQKIKDKIAAIDLTDISWTNAWDKVQEFAAISEELNTLIETIKNEAEYLGYHQFGASALTDENGNVQEILQITYGTDTYFLKDEEVKVTLVDDRTATVLNAGSLSFEYDEYNNDSLLAAITLTDDKGNPVEGELKILADMSGKNVGEHKFNVYYDGSWDYKPVTAEFTLNVVKAPSNVTAENLIVTYGSSYNPAPVVTNKHGEVINVDTVEFVVGLDVADFDIDGDGVKGLVGHVQLMLPKDLQNIFDMIGLKDGATMSLSDLVGLLNNDLLSGVLGEWGITSEFAATLQDVLNSINDVVEAGDMEITIGGSYPTNIGAYLRGAVTVDANYDTAFGVGYLVIKPDASRVYLDFNYNDSNGLFTSEALKYVNLGASAFDDEALTSLNSDATGMVNNLFFGVDSNGELVLTLFNEEVDPEQIENELDNGAYTQMAFIAEFDNEFYYAVPIVRAFAMVPQVCDVQMLGANGEDNNDLLVKFDNQPQGFNVKVTDMAGNEVVNTYTGNTSEDLKVTYVGVQTNTNTYNSTEKPTHAGVYSAIATYIEKDANGKLIMFGMDAGVLVIEPTEATVDVEDKILYINEVSENVYFKDQVTAASSVAGLTPDTTVISAGIDTDGSFTEEGMAAVRGTVNVDFPKWVDELIDQYAPSVKNGITLSELEEKLFNKLPEISDALAQQGATEEVINSFSNLIETVNKVLAELPDEVTLSFKDDAYADRVGAFAVIAVVTDSDHIPAVDAGILVVLPEVTQVELKWNYEDSNGIWTHEILENYDMYATAYDVENGEKDAEATKKITYKFISTDENGEITIYDTAENLPYGAYVELAYIELMVDSYMTVSDMIARPIVYVPQVYDVQLLDAAGNANNDLLLTFNNQPQGFGVKVTNMDGKVIEPGDDLTVTYVGIEANTKTYNSTEKPVHTGAYMAVATYIERDAEGNVLAAGMDTGVLVIQPTEATITVDDKAEVITNVNDKVYFKEQVTATSTVAGLTPDTTVISAAVNTDGSFSEEGLAAVRGTVNVDFPRWADELIAKYAPGAVEGMTVADFSDKVLSKLPVITELMAQYGATEEMVRSFTNLFNNINAVLAEVPEEVTLSFKDNAYADRVGVYLVVGFVTDSDHIPAMDTGVLVITPDVQIAELTWKEIDLNGVITQPVLESFDFSAYDALERHSDKISYVLYGVDDDGETVYIEGSNADYEAFAAKCAALENGVYTQVAFVPGEVNSVIPVAEVIMRSFVVSPQNVTVNVEDTTVVYDGTGKTAPVTAQYADGSTISEAMLAENLTVRYVGLETVNGTYDDVVPPTNVGVYAVVAEYIVRDENDIVYFGVNTGYLTITPAQAKLEMLDDVQVCPDSEYTVEDLYKVEPAGLHVVAVVVDENNNVNIILPELPGVDTVESVSITVDGGKADVKALISRLPEQVQAALAALYVGAMNSELGDELQAIIDKLEQVNVLSINGALPTEEGIYKTYGFTAGRNYSVSLPDSAGLLTVGHKLTKVEANAPGCTEEGNIEHYECENCDKLFSDAEAENEITAEDVVIPATNHSYGEPSFTWSDDYSSAEATATCPNCEEGTEGHSVTVECEVTSEVTKQPTCTEPGEKTYTATVTIGDKTYTDTQTEEIPAKDHAYSAPEFTWADDYSSAEATATCPNCEEGTEGHSVTVECEVTSEVTKQPTCTEPGEKTYTATVTIGDKTYTDTQTEEIPAKDHAYSAPEFTWADDYSSAEATATCPDCEEGTEGHSVTVECEITEERKEPTATENGYIKYTATVEINGVVYTDTKTVELSVSKEGLYPIKMDPASHGTIVPNGTIYVDGVAYKMDENCVAWVPMDDALMVTTYEYNMDSEDPHDEYPIHMYVWELTLHGEKDEQWNAEENYTADRVEELDDIMLYAGTSIRMTGKQGIRVITSIDSNRRATLINSNLAGFSLKEYGTMFCWAENEDGTPKAEPTQGAATSYAYLKGQRDSIFHNTGSAIQYTGMLVDLQDELLDDDLLFRPYMVLEKNGVEYILYGGTLQRSIGYVAYQNRNYNPNPAAYNFIWNIIHVVYGDKYDADYKG